jgi:diguanylate cyclase (GGDEF)-like protein/PAS domain S-box-containing protein
MTSAATPETPASGSELSGTGRLDSPDARLMADATPHIVFMASPDGATTYFNERGTEYTGCPRETNYGWNWVTLVHPDDAERARKAWDIAVASETEFLLDYRVRRHDGAFLWHEVRARPARWSDGRIQVWIGTATDIDARTRLELSLRTSEREAHETLALLETIGAAAPVGFKLVDRDLRVVRINENLARISGMVPDEVLGRTAPEMVPDLWPQLEDAYRRALDGETTSGMDVSRADLDDPGKIRHWLASYFPVRSQDEIIGVGNVVVEITDRKEAEARIAHQAGHDSRTGLPNRRLLTDRLDEMLAAETTAATTIVLVDICQFDLVNDVFGFDLGDLMIEQCAEDLVGAVHPDDVLARVSDHTFAVACPHQSTESEAVSYAETLRSLLAGRQVVGGVGLHLQVAAATATVADSAVVAAELIRRADSALLVARRGGTTRAFDESIHAGLVRQFELEALVARAIARGGVTLGYQPVVRLHDQATIGAEALLRLPDANGEPVPALDLVHAAERSGRIGELGELVLRRACTDAATWQAAIPDRRISISVNVSAQQLDDPAFPEKVSTIVETSGLDPSSLCLEITESALMIDPDRSADILVDLKARGFRLSADDFGTGYSSLAYLKRFPLDEVKIDRSFVAGLPFSLEDIAITQAVVALAEALDLVVMAEGVETASQFEELKRQGVPHAQGFLWSRAVPSADLLARLLRESDGGIGMGPHFGGTAHVTALASGATPDDRLDSVLRLLAHEVRGPLTVVRGYASMLELDPSALDLAGPMASISRAAERIEQVLDIVMELSTTEATTLRLALLDVDIVELTRTAINDISVTLDHPLVLRELPSQAVQVRVDPGQIVQILDNLVSNAAKYSPPDHPIEVGIVVGDGTVEIWVADRGPGIRPEDLALVFRKYGRVADHIDGTGIGLYLARRIARNHGGDVVYRRPPSGPGSVLALQLPRHLPAELAAHTEPMARWIAD